MVNRRNLKVTALRIQQRSDVPLMVFGVGGRSLQRFVSVDAAERSNGGALHGYQRERVSRHIAEIRAYLLSPEAILPNAIVISIDEGAASFKALEGFLRSEWGTPGRLTIQLPGRGEAKPAFVIDGQQRMSALSSLPPDRDFPVVVVGFISASEDLQRDQFVLVNKSRPLPRDLLNELLPKVRSPLPHGMQGKKIATTVLEVLRFDRSSIFYGRVRGLGETGEGANISQAALISVIEKSMRKGILSAGASDRVRDAKELAAVMNTFYTGVARTWPKAWEASPWSSRLVHGVGIFAMGRLMDELMPEINLEGGRSVGTVHRRLKALVPYCAWMEGRWPGINLPWNGLQNTSQDKRLLSDHMISSYRKTRGQ